MNSKKTAAILAIILLSLQIMAAVPSGADAINENSGTVSYNGITVSYVDSSQEGWGIISVFFATVPDEDDFTISIDGSMKSAPINVNPGRFAVPGGLSEGEHHLSIECGSSSWNLVLVVSGVVHATGVDIDQSTISMTVGQTRTLRAVILPTDAVETNVEWRSSNVSVATVSNGVVKAVSAGTAVITASVGDLSDTCSVSVSSPAPDPPTPQHTHSWGSGTVTKEPTCTESGERTYTCSCGETRTETISALGHQWSDWTIVKEATDNEEGLKERVCQKCGEKETATIAKTVVVTNNDGTTTETKEEVDGTIVSTTTGAEDGSVKVDKVKEDIDKDGNQVTTSSSEVRDKDGNEIYSKTEESVQGVQRTDDSGNKVTESSVSIVEKDDGKITVTEENTKETVAADGSRQTEVVRTENVTEADGSTSAKTVTENTKETVAADGSRQTEVVRTENVTEADGSTSAKTVTENTKETVAADGSTEVTKVTETVKEDEVSTLSSVQTEVKDRDGKVVSNKVVEAESKDGSVRSAVEIPQDSEKAEIVTTVKSDSADGNHTVSKEQIEQAVVIQEKVSEEVAEDTKEQSKVIQVESATADASLTVSQEAVRAVTESGSALRMSSETGSLTVSNQVLGNISEEDEITISVSEAKEQDMSDAQRKTVTNDAVVVDVRITAGDRSLGDSLGGTVTIAVKYVPANGKVPAAYYIDDNGAKERMDGVRYDAERKEISFESTHCSLYMVVDENPESESPGSDNTMLFIGIGAAILAALLVAVLVIVRRK